MDSHEDKSKHHVEDIPSTLDSKHPLQYRWTLHFYENKKGFDWAECLHEVYTFGTVEDFWCMYHSIKLVNELPHGCDYYIFKTGIKPMWEDDRNKNGGRWLFNVDNRLRQQINSYWLHTLLFMIGESFDQTGDEICGTCINIRGKGEKISLWTKDANNKDKILEIGKTLKENCFQLPSDVKLYYEKHSDQQAKTTSKAKNLYVI